MSRLLSLLRVPVALGMSFGVSMLSCHGASAVVGLGHFGSGFGASIVRLVLPFVVGAMVGGWAFYLLMVGERRDLRPRRAKRTTKTPRIPRPASVAAMCLSLVFGVVAVWLFGLTSVFGPAEDAWYELFAMFAIGAALLFGVTMALFLGIAAAIARARSKRESASDLPAAGA